MLTRRFTKQGKARTISYPEATEWKFRSVMIAAVGETRYETSRLARSAAMQTVARWLSDRWIEDAGPRKVVAKVALPLEYDETVAVVIAADLPEHPDWQEVFRRLGADGVKNVTVRRRLLAAVQRAHRDRSDERERMRRVEAIAAEIRSRGEDRKTRAAADEAAMAKALSERQMPAIGGQRRIDFSEE